MEKYLRKYFWTLNLVTIMACAWLLAESASTIAGSIMADDFVANVSAAPAPKTDGQQQLAAAKIQKTSINPFDGSELNPAPEEMDPSEIPPDEMVLPTGDPNDFGESTACRKTSVPGTLVGTMAASDPGAGFAMLENSDKKIEMLEVGDQVQVGVTVVAVVRHKVFLDNNGAVECFIHGDAAEKPLANPQAEVVPDDEGIRKVDETTYIISRNEIQRAMENLNMLATQARIVPSFKNGQSNGFRIYSIKPGSLFQKIGLKNGDVLQQINGDALDSPEKALQLYTKLRAENKITIALLRRGQKMQMDYTIQ